MSYPGYKDVEARKAYLRKKNREYRKHKKTKAIADKHKLQTYQTNSRLQQDSITQERGFATESGSGEYAGQTYPISVVMEQIRKHGVATDSVEGDYSACADKRMEMYGESPEEAWRKCEESGGVCGDVKHVSRRITTDKKQPVKKVRHDNWKREPKVLEKTFCAFCLTMHPTKVLCEDGTVKSFPISTFHIKPQMRIDSLGLTREATNQERCVSAIMDVQGVSQEEAEGVCKQLLEDPVFRHDFLNHPMVWKHSELRNPTKEDKYVAAWVSLTKDTQPEACHPEIGALIFHKEEEEAEARIGTVDKTVEGLDNIYGKTKTQLIAETLHPTKYAGRLTVGDIYAEKQKKKGREQLKDER